MFVFSLMRVLGVGVGKICLAEDFMKGLIIIL